MDAAKQKTKTKQSLNYTVETLSREDPHYFFLTQLYLEKQSQSYKESLQVGRPESLVLTHLLPHQCPVTSSAKCPICSKGTTYCLAWTGMFHAFFLFFFSYMGHADAKEHSWIRYILLWSSL